MELPSNKSTEIAWKWWLGTGHLLNKLSALPPDEKPKIPSPRPMQIAPQGNIILQENGANHGKSQKPHLQPLTSNKELNPKAKRNKKMQTFGIKLNLPPLLGFPRAIVLAFRRCYTSKIHNDGILNKNQAQQQADCYKWENQKEVKWVTLLLPPLDVADLSEDLTALLGTEDPFPPFSAITSFCNYQLKKPNGIHGTITSNLEMGVSELVDWRNVGTVREPNVPEGSRIRAPIRLCCAGFSRIWSFESERWKLFSGYLKHFIYRWAGPWKKDIAC